MIISRTPFRISFFGGGTDFQEFYAEHGGSTLLTAIDQYCYVSVHKLGEFYKHRFRASYAQTELVQHPSEFRHPLIREALLLLDVKEGMEITHIADLPGRTGLGSSSSFTVGLLHAVHAFLGQPVTAETLAQESIVVERDRVRDSGGHQDQYAAACGGFVRLRFSGNRQVQVTPVAISAPRRQELQDKLMMFYMGVEQSAELILQEQTRKVSVNVPALREMLAMVDESERILTGRSTLDDFGRLLHESWMRKRSLSAGISNSDIDDAYDLARKAGALGGKLLGAGGRGFLLLYVPAPAQQAVRTALSALKQVRFAFSPEGSRIIFNSAS